MSRTEGKRAYYQANQPEIVRKAIDWKRTNKEKAAAHRAVREGLDSGHLIKPLACEVCGTDGQTEAHHDSYELHLQWAVVWMCRPCHQYHHARQRDLSAAADRQKGPTGPS